MTEWLTKLFERPVEPLPQFEHPILGRSNWSEDNEAWLGSFNGFSYLLFYEGQKTPADDLSAYAVRMLSGKEQFLAAINSAKVDGLGAYPLSYSDEIRGLKLGLVYFYRNEHRLRILADLDGGHDHRAWWVEFLEQRCEGIGFDS